MPSSLDNHAPFVISSPFGDPNADGHPKPRKPEVIVCFNNSSALISILCCLIKWPFNIGTKGTTTRDPNKCHNF
jgi:hypothetical protein